MPLFWLKWSQGGKGKPASNPFFIAARPSCSRVGAPAGRAAAFSSVFSERRERADASESL